MATILRTFENKEINRLVSKLTGLINSGNDDNLYTPVLKRKSNVFSLSYNVSVHQPHLTLIDGAKSRSELISRVKDCINSITLLQSCWLDKPVDIVDDYHKNMV